MAVTSKEEGGGEEAGDRRSPQLLPLLRTLFDDYQNDHRSARAVETLTKF